MGMQINTNLAANNTYRNLASTQTDMAKSLERLSSGLRINRAGDDAAGLAISEGLKSQVGGLTVASRNAQDAVSVIQTAEGSLSEVQTILQRVRDLAVQAGNGSNNAKSRDAIATEVTALGLELTRISESTNFNGTKLLNTAAATTDLTFQIGAGGTAAADQIDVKLTDVSAIGTAVSGLATAGFADSAAALATINTIDGHITAVSTSRASLGADQNRFESVIRNLAVSKENLTAAGSRIRDTDMAEEMVKYTRSSILSQAGTAMLAQANQSNQGVLSLLR
ncbi:MULTISPECIES: flagellin [Cryobacterium]|uniref:Flagellin n=1 Tax=Cryobacterium zongtaii TaxID=1259217 RepID=A0A2S3Z9B0_9MICO|nr:MULTISPECIES: flagellin [Cryobacterium]ASD21920.1 flagellin [Cryobacterium sp. LW097]POH62131.1 flagellin [Cryobacterium zongtaii]POH68011.1 flagellin [Cryobacterium zongtaii]TFC48017.1 flagellin [Cryobacterium sp. TMN-39-2]TFC53504.1 flagellin [Cryobacterium sp. TMB3-1-2]